MRSIAVLGSTGSVGTQALEVAARHADRFRVVALCAHSRAEELFDQVRRFQPEMAGLVLEPAEIPADLRHIHWVFGPECARAAARWPSAQDALVAVVGAEGLGAVLEGLKAGKRILLANKEALVAGGALVVNAAKEAGQPLLPVDSEHSAIFQCLQGAGPNRIRKLFLTASGGPFRTWAAEEIEKATPEMALKHPNWSMGAKITVDSASMMNKALEIIEARWLFDVAPDRIEAVVHPQSIVHSMIEYDDGAVVAQLGAPDMRLPILYAMSYPERLETGVARLDFQKLGTLTFEAPDPKRFPALRLAYESLEAGGAAPAVLNAANEATVALFLQRRIPFGKISAWTEDALGAVAPGCSGATLESLLEADAAARRYIVERVKREGFLL
ncbi:MAG TPA: 1-deoxy-D-xylulose-5-phosphate reductoisomerase [Clostridia bacterium]|nr:1-deoxy-D-xylulose-5-phosphate reductoisomerase [Clostridia bacterium]